MSHVLVVDDNSSICLLLKILLEREGHKVAVEENGLAALARAESEFPEAAIIDIHLPGCSGVEVCRKLKERARELGKPLDVWLMTGGPEGDLERRGRDAGARKLFRKPFDSQKMLFETGLLGTAAKAR